MRSCCTWLITAPRPPLCSAYGHREPALGKTVPGRCCRARGAWGGMATEINWRTRGGGRSGFLRMLQALGKRQSCRRARAGPCEGSGSPGAEDGEQGWGRWWDRNRKDAGAAAEDGVPWAGGQHLKHPDEHRQWGKLCPSPWGGLAGRGGWWDQALCLLSMPGGRGSRLMAASRQGWAGEAGSFPVLPGMGTSSSCLALELLRGTVYL